MKPDRSLLSILKTVSKALDHFREFLSNQTKLTWKGQLISGFAALLRLAVQHCSSFRSCKIQALEQWPCWPPAFAPQMPDHATEQRHAMLLQLHHGRCSQSGTETAKSWEVVTPFSIGKQHCCFCPAHFYQRQTDRPNFIFGWSSSFRWLAISEQLLVMQSNFGLCSILRLPTRNQQG